ncbi:hypothetical protein O181_007876 [Austropuccinia psidii MF-1]|uniref:Uncharacterized protein n=1 Tax=Austropuccinia psidii MF-1 TaxID=1389203 RepID=A0A9Q3GI08_9BASI|nr:hypothetical protein [Austropuccinia psidii MF-1]
MENKQFNLASCWEELGARFQKICLREISFKDLIKITEIWNLNKQFKLLKESGAKIRKNEATIQDRDEQLIQKESILNPSGSQGVDQPNSQVASHHSESSK